MPFEYRVISISLNCTASARQEILNRQGAEGWRLIQDIEGEMIFIREKPAPRPYETKEQY